MILIPIAVTIIMYAIACYMVYVSDNGASNIGAGLGNLMDYMIYYGTATIVSLIVWLLWALTALLR